MPHTSDDAFDSFADDLLGERSARSLIIVGASRIDILLQEILDAYLLPKRAKAKENDELLEGDRPLATFSARIKLCYRVGIFDDTLCAALEALRTLRNPSAHHVTFDITQSPVRDHFVQLRNRLATRQSFQLIKQRYFDASSLSPIEDLQCVLLTLCALLVAVREKIKRTTGNKTTLRISTK
jgi:DNA-binding MltR family transcriptional regulator